MSSMRQHSAKPVSKPRHSKLQQQQHCSLPHTLQSHHGIGKVGTWQKHKGGIASN